MAAVSNWNDCLYKSLAKAASDEAIIKQLIPGCAQVVKTDIAQDKRGIDYIAILHGGAEIKIDVKRRALGSAKHWANGEPDIALEPWSKIASDGYTKIGWTLNTETEVDLILFLFDDLPDKYYLVPFQLLRKAYLANTAEWNKLYPPRNQTTIADDGSEWRAQVQFIPLSVLIAAINKVSCNIY